MKMQNRKKQVGFTLIELMIVLAIIAILASVAIPGYFEQIKKGRRTDAQTILMSFAQSVERHYTENSTYVSAAVGGTPGAAPVATVFASQAPLDGNTKYYNLTLQLVTATTYTLRAAPISGGAQDGDGFLELTSAGIRSWDKNDDGDSADADENCWRSSC